MENSKLDLSSLKINRNVEPKKNYNKNNKVYILYSIITLIVIFAMVILYNKINAPEIEVKLLTVQYQSPSYSNAVLTASGYVVAQRKASVASKASGRLIYLGVVEGDKVKKNQTIAKLENEDVLASLEQAKANLKLSEADLQDAQQSFNRQKILLDKGLANQAEYDAASARLQRVLASIEVAQALVRSAEVALENTFIRAPFDGTVLTKNADVGEMVVPMSASVGSKSAVVTIADMSSLQVEADVAESNIERIKIMQPCEITLDAYPQTRYKGFVDKIIPTADRAKATVMVKVGFVNYDEKVLPEMGAKVLFLSNKLTDLELSKKPTISIPSSSVKIIDGNFYVYKIVDNIAQAKNIIAETKTNNMIEVKDGLFDGEKIILNVDENIYDGVKVKVK